MMKERIMSKKTRNLIGGVSLLGIVGLICKVVGVLYRIPLAQVIGAQGIAVYQQVFPSYNLLLTISSAGIPVAISRMVSHCMAQNDPRNASRVFRASLVMLMVLGAVTTIALFCLNDALAQASGTPEAAIGFAAIAPSLFFVCVMSAFRGSLQGRQQMAPTAISQLIEQVGKVFIALPFSVWFYALGDSPTECAALGAAGALLGTSVAELLALVFIGIRYLLGRREFSAIAQDETHKPLSYGYLCRHILAVALPITIGACIVPMASTVDSFMLVNIMSGFLDREEAMVRYGVYTGLVFPLINVPTAVAMAMSINLVPSISKGVAKKDTAHIKSESATGLRLASLIGLPCSVGMSLLAHPILNALYGEGGRYTAAQLQLGGELLTVSALTILFFIYVQATSGILQGLRKQRIPMYTLLVGVGLKIVLNYSLVRIPSINIHGAPFASLLCYITSMVPNLYYVVKYSRLKLNVMDLIVRPGIATAVMGGAVMLMVVLIGRDTLNGSLLLVIAVIFVAMAVYAVAAVMLRAIKREDVPAPLRRFVPEEK